MRSVINRGAALLFFSLAVMAGGEGTLSPGIYVLDYYQPLRLLNPAEYARQFQGAPCTLLDFGSGGPFLWSWGPVRDSNGIRYPVYPYFPPAWGKSLPPNPTESDIYFTPGEFRAYTDRMRAGLAAIYATGVERIACYTCPGYAGLEPENKLGLNWMYEHWEEWSREFPLLGKKPESPPETWIQIDEKGNSIEQSRQRWGLDLGSPLTRTTAMCTNNPDYLHWLEACVKYSALAGFNTVHIDTLAYRPLGCYCRFCTAGFRDWLAGRYDARRLKTLFGFNGRSEIRRPAVIPEALRADLLYVEWRLFMEEHQLQVCDHFRRAGESIAGRGKFYIHTGGLPDKIPAFGRVDTTIQEQSDVFIGQTDRTLAPNLVHHRIQSFAPVLKIDQGLADTPDNQGQPRTATLFTKSAMGSRYTQRLSIAEAAAFGSGTLGCSNTCPESNRSSAQFLTEHGELYRGFHGAALIGLIYDPRQHTAIMGNGRHLGATLVLLEEFLENQIPVDIVLSTNLRPEVLSRYSVLAAAQWHFVSDRAIACLKDYVRRGGTLIIDEDFGAGDSVSMTPRKKSLAWGENSRVLVHRPGLDPSRLRKTAGEIDRRIAPLVQMEGGTVANGLFSNLLRRTSESKTITTVHLVNYRVPSEIGIWDKYSFKHIREPRPPSPLKNLTVTVPLDSPDRVVSVNIFSPDPEIKPACACTKTPEGVRISVPEVFIYSLIVIEQRA